MNAKRVRPGMTQEEYEIFKMIKKALQAGMGCQIVTPEGYPTKTPLFLRVESEAA
jgi:hypothetical protein